MLKSARELNKASMNINIIDFQTRVRDQRNSNRRWFVYTEVCSYLVGEAKLLRGSILRRTE
jgi:hypothetical protein